MDDAQKSNELLMELTGTDKVATTKDFFQRSPKNEQQFPSKLEHSYSNRKSHKPNFKT